MVEAKVTTVGHDLLIQMGASTSECENMLTRNASACSRIECVGPCDYSSLKYEESPVSTEQYGKRNERCRELRQEKV